MNACRHVQLQRAEMGLFLSAGQHSYTLLSSSWCHRFGCDCSDPLGRRWAHSAAALRFTHTHVPAGGQQVQHRYVCSAVGMQEPRLHLHSLLNLMHRGDALCHRSAASGGSAEGSSTPRQCCDTHLHAVQSEGQTDLLSALWETIGRKLPPPTLCVRPVLSFPRYRQHAARCSSHHGSLWVFWGRRKPAAPCEGLRAAVRASGPASAPAWGGRDGEPPPGGRSEAERGRGGRVPRCRRAGGPVEVSAWGGGGDRRELLGPGLGAGVRGPSSVSAREAAVPSRPVGAAVLGPIAVPAPRRRWLRAMGT